MKIRKATEKDARRISYLIKRNTDQVKENKHTAKQRAAWKNENTPSAIKAILKQREIFCAFENEKLIGTIGLEGNNLVGLYISYTKRGQGIGHKLLVFLENYAKKKNIKELHLTATPNGHGFYIKHGYEGYGKINLKYGEVIFVETKMKKRLT